MRDLTILKNWQKFMITAIVVGLVSIIWNKIFLPDTTTIVLWINFLEKIFAFILLGIIFSFFNAKILKLDNFGRSIFFSSMVALLITIAEILNSALDSSLFLQSFIIRFIGAIGGIYLVNLFYRRK